MKRKPSLASSCPLFLLCLLLCALLPAKDAARAAEKAPLPSSKGPNAEWPTASAGALDGDEASLPAERITYQEGFYYEPISEPVWQRIQGLSYGADCTVALEDLRYVGILYVDFYGQTKQGELICHQSIAQDLAEIFYALYQEGYPLESVRLIDDFGADDILSMEHNNTSCFNYRTVEGTRSLSRHAYGLAVDINPLYNPYVSYSGQKQRVSPAVSAPYADRSQDFPNKIDKEDLCYQLFTEHGFTWGGDWKNTKDYQHFQKELPTEE